MKIVTDRNFYKTMFRIALPAAFQALVSFLVIVADDIMVSRLANGVDAQAAVAQVNSITALYTSSILGFASGSAVLISQYWGKNDVDRIKRIFSCVLIFCSCISIAVVLFARLFPGNIVSLLVSRDNTAVFDLAVRYFKIVCFSYIPYAVSYSIISMLRSVEVVKITLYIAVMSLFLNVGLNYALIFGKLGFPEMGVSGAATATFITRIAELVLVWSYAFYIQKRFPVKPSELLNTDRQLFKDYLRYGFPAGLVDMQWSLIGMFKAAIIGHLGSVFMAANSIANSMLNLGTLFTFALAGGACVVVGKAVGVGDFKRARQYSDTIQLMFAGLGIVMAAVVYFIRGAFTSLYGSSSDAQVYELSCKLITLLAISLIFSCYHASCFVGINRGGGDSRFVAGVDTVCGWLIVLPMTFLSAFVFKWSMPAIYLCTRCDQYFKWIIAFIRLRGNKWIKNVTRE